MYLDLHTSMLLSLCGRWRRLDIPLQVDGLPSWRTNDNFSTSERSEYDGIIGFLRGSAHPALHHVPMFEHISSGCACPESQICGITHRFDGSGSRIWNSTPNHHDTARLPSTATQDVRSIRTPPVIVDGSVPLRCWDVLMKISRLHCLVHACLTDIPFLTVLRSSAMMVGISCHEAATLKIFMIHLTLSLS